MESIKDMVPNTQLLTVPCVINWRTTATSAADNWDQVGGFAVSKGEFTAGPLERVRAACTTPRTLWEGMCARCAPLDL